MASRVTRTLIVLSLAGLAVPAGATAAEGVAPPGSSDAAASTAAVESDPGCEAKAVIAFKGAPESQVRHVARVRCRDVKVRIRCNSNLLAEGVRISRERNARANRCRAASAFADSGDYPAGTEFTQRYRLKLKLKKRFQSWTGTTDECPKRSKNKRTLTCRGSQTTVAPERSVDGFSS